MFAPAARLHSQQSQKFSRLRRGYYPSNYSNHNYPDDVLRKVIIRKQLFRWRCSNTIIQRQLFRWRFSKAIIYMTLLKSNYSTNNYSNIIHEAATTQAIFKFTCGYRTLYTGTKRFGKEKFFAAGANFFKYKSWNDRFWCVKHGKST